MLERVQRETVGYVETAKDSWRGLVQRYLVEDASVDPMVTLVANDNWIEFTLRYVVDFKRRRHEGRLVPSDPGRNRQV